MDVRGLKLIAVIIWRKYTLTFKKNQTFLFKKIYILTTNHEYEMQIIQVDGYYQLKGRLGCENNESTHKGTTI